MTLVASCAAARGATPAQVEHFRKEIQPILAEYCYDCHGDGSKKGSVAFDGFASDAELLAKRDLWYAVLKNVRANMMPPARKAQPTEAEVKRLESWIKDDVFGIDPAHPDPGRVTLRRLNRAEYRNTIRDLMGIDFNTTEEFPPDDTGYGFDNIGDVLTISPLLLEKYMQASETIVARAVPSVGKMVGERVVRGGQFRAADGGGNGDRLSFYKPARVTHKLKLDQPGTYRVTFNLRVDGHFDFDPGRSRVTIRIDGQERAKEEMSWHNGKDFPFEYEVKWEPGEREFSVEMEPLVSEDKKKNPLDLRIQSVRIVGPMDERHWVRTKNHERFFPREDTPKDEAERRTYAREVLAGFTRKAFRRPVDDRTLDRLTKIAEAAWNEPGKTFEQGVGQAMVAVLASPRFLFRVEDVERADALQPAAPVDEYALASRLSYFLWSTMPDDELFGLAERGELRKNLSDQVKRMLGDGKSDELIENFVGQWIQSRDVETIAINARAVIRREGGRPPRGFDLDGELRRSMRRETEMFFGHVLKEDRSVLDLLDSDYTFLNERLAKHYAIDGVQGNQMRRVELPEGSPRGGLLTQGSVLVVT